MGSDDIRRKYIEFFKSHGHAVIPSAPLVPQNDPTTLFTSSGMQPLIPYLLGEPHPSGKRLVNSQKSFRAQDIEEVGDTSHTTFFEMLGNWSLGEYFKKEQLPWIWEFLTKILNLPKDKLYVSVFEGGDGVPKDEESIAIWKSLGVADGQIFSYGFAKNWWSRSGEPDRMPTGEPGGPDSEVFYDFGEDLGLHEKSVYKDKECHPNCQCGRFMEVANSVFMQYQKQADGSLKELAQKNVDFGGGLERMAAAVNNDPDIFNIDIFSGAKRELEEVTLGDSSKSKSNLRIILDHIRAAIFLIDDGVEPSNKAQGYILRRLIRRAALHSKTEGTNIDLESNLPLMINEICSVYGSFYPSLLSNKGDIAATISKEFSKFEVVLKQGIKEIEKAKPEDLNARYAFNSLATYGLPFEVTQKLAQDKGVYIDKEEFEEEFKKHQDLSRTAASGMFKGGLADHSEKTVRLHTAHHLLLAALQKVVDPGIKQRGSNITAERLRMDFNFGRKLTPEEIKKVEELVNEKITQNLSVTRVEMDRGEAERIGAQMEFGAKYPDRVSVYFVGPQKDYFSSEFCGGPHVSFTGELGHLTIMKEESAGAGVRRVYATLSNHETSRSGHQPHPTEA
jgi:alanyl-tRNA synthetase